jgi:hypothetical protein
MASNKNGKTEMDKKYFLLENCNNVVWLDNTQTSILTIFGD